MRLFSHFPRFFCAMSVVALAGFYGLTAVSAEELVGKPVPIAPNAEQATLHSEPNEPPVAAQIAANNAQVAANEAQVASNEAEFERNIERMVQSELEQHLSDPNVLFGASQLGSEVIVPVVALSFIFGGPIFLIAFLILLSYRNKRRREANINMNIDKLLTAGRDIPVELLRGDEPKSTYTDDQGNLSKGIKNICIGVGLFIFLTLLCGVEVGSVAFILIGLGVSRVLVWKFTQTNTTPKEAAQD